MRLLLDEMYPPDAAGLLRNEGIDAQAVTESPELIGLADSELLAAAFADRRVLVTENVVDFAVLSRTADHVGIVYCHYRRFPRDANHIRRLVTALLKLREQPPHGLGRDPVEWWLDSVTDD